jgi:hypothetical protein
MMERFASAYGRALFPGRYGSRDKQPMGLEPGGIEIAMGAGIYRAVVRMERLLDGLRQRAAEWRAKPAPGPRATPVGCG